MSASFIAVDWGTTRARAYLMKAGTLQAQTGSDMGVQSVPPDGFPQALRQLCGDWLREYPGIPVALAGMVGSRNGWVEAPYMPVPCGLGEVARHGVRFTLDGHAILLVPGVDMRRDDGFYDVMRGEETLAFGAGLDSGLFCLPGTHSKWIVMRDGKITDFATFITGELYAAMRESFIGKLAREPARTQPGGQLGQGAAARAGGLARALFQARARVLAGDMDGDGVQPFLSALLIADEIAQARQMFAVAGTVHLIASQPLADIYADAFAVHGIPCALIAPEPAFLGGTLRIIAASGAL
ncbi:MAG: 2-dehydro-3-deoxygalactonokinase [Hyphomicrobiales bacterium]|nr:2-dehydro-3-deoxygalactonokinase [Hyphomicrobiales bacterium]MDE2115555.1 2-dehydro-3-deoxygalactonokinase [Hyphomicrobiales bacterium]